MEVKKEEITSGEVKSNADESFKTINCQYKDCNNKINIPANWDEDYEKNERRDEYDFHAIPNSANMHQALGVFACDGCFDKFIADNWDPPEVRE